MKRRILALVLCWIMVMSMVMACSGPSEKDVTTDVTKNATTGEEQKKTKEVPASVTEPITIEIWHPRGAGQNGDMIAASVEEFNRTNKFGITVVEVFQGGYPVTLTKTMQAISAGTQPALVVLERAAGVPVMAEQDVLLDMTPYIERDNFDMDNFLQVLLGYSYYNDEIISLPYIRSTPVFYYNKSLFEKAGYTEPPKTFTELEEIGKKLVADGLCEYGFELLNDPAWFVQNLMYQLGSNMLSEDGLSAPCLEDGALLSVLTSWRKWVDDGWCAPFVSTSAESAMKEQFYQGNLASFVASSGGLANIINNSVDFELGVSYFPTLSDITSAPTGGGNIAIVERGNDEQTLAAAWEFVKFLMSDEQVALNAANTGYLPITYSSATSQVLIDQWKEQPLYKVAYDQLEVAQELPWSGYKADFEELLKEYCSYVIQDQSQTPEEAVEQIKLNSYAIFPLK